MCLEPEPFLSDQDKKVINLVLEHKKRLIVFVNKWDLLEASDQMRQDLMVIAETEVPALANIPFVFGSAKTAVRVGKLVEQMETLAATMDDRIPTPQVNRIFDRIFKRNPPRAKKGKNVKIYYATQVETRPPTFVCFVNHPKLIEQDYIRFMEKRFRTEFPGYLGIPLQFVFKSHRKEQDPSESK